MWNSTRTDLFNQLPIDSSDVVFVGTSLTEGFPTQELFHTMHVKNRGIGGNSSFHVLNRIESILNGKPKKLFLEIGINDIIAGVSEDSLFCNFKRIAAVTKLKSPGTQLFVQSILPTCKSFGFAQPEIISFNRRAENFCKEQGISFIDIYRDLCKNKGLDSSLTYDGLHLNGKGYFIWKNRIQSDVR